MQYSVHFTKKAKKDLKKLSSPYQDKILVKILQLRTNRHPQQFKTLVDSLTQYRLRIGDYRVLYDIYEKDKAVLILSVGHRKEIYLLTQ